MATAQLRGEPGGVGYESYVADGALAGAAAGGLGGAAEAHGERRQIVMNCMEGRGHNIVG